jgi:hypothetical protein
MPPFFSFFQRSMRTLSGISGNKKGKTPDFSVLSFPTTYGSIHKITCPDYGYPPPELKKVPKVCHIHLWLSFDTHFHLKQRVMPHQAYHKNQLQLHTTTIS